MHLSQQRIGHGLAAVSLALIAAVTLYPLPGAASRAAATPLTCIACGELGGVDLLLNVLLFVPLGVGLTLARFSVRRALVLAALLTFLIELLQMKVVPGRDASLGDVLANTLGGGLGAVLGAHWRRWIRPDPRTARRLALAWTLLLTWIWVGSAWGFGPTWPTGSPWFGQWAPDLGHLKHFPGHPLTITAGGEPLLPGPALDQARLEDAVAADPTMRFRAVLGPPTDGLAPVGSIYDGRQREVLLLGQDHRDLAFRTRIRATILRLRNPYATLPGGMAGEPGDTVDAEGSLLEGRLILQARNGSRIATRLVPLSASLGWALVAPWNARLDGRTAALTALWVGCLLIPLAYWGALAAGAAALLAPATTGVLLVVVPVTAGFPPVGWTEWAAAALGILAGSLAARRVRRWAWLPQAPLEQGGAAPLPEVPR